MLIYLFYLRPHVVSREVCHIKQGRERQRNWCGLISLSSAEISLANKTLNFLIVDYKQQTITLYQN